MKPIKKLLLAFLIISFCFISLNAQNTAIEWAKRTGGTRFEELHSIAIDFQGNILSAGGFVDTVDFDPGTGVYKLASNGYEDIFIQKLDLNGNFLWANAIGSKNTDIVSDIATDANGNVFTVGHFVDTVDFDPGIGINNLISKGDYDIFIQKLDSSGKLIWIKQIGGTLPQYSFGIEVDTSGNVLVSGHFGGTTDFDPGLGVSNLTAKGTDFFVLKLDNDGNYVWVKKCNNIGGPKIATDLSGNVFVTASFSITTDFDPNAGVLKLTPNGVYDLFVLKLDKNGDFVWVKQVSGTNMVQAEFINTDSFGNVYTIGKFKNTVDFNPGSGITNLTSKGGWDVFIHKLDSAGNFQWVSQIEGTRSNMGYSVTADNEKNVYSTGFFLGKADFDSGPDVFNLDGKSTRTAFVQKLDSSGNMLWAKKFNGNVRSEGRAIAVDNIGSIYVGGIFDDTVDFDLGSKEYNLISNNSVDLFIQKMIRCDSITTYIYENACDSFTWSANNLTYYQTGIYSDTILSLKGCDSVLILNLNLLTNNPTTLIETACDSFYWSNTNLTYDTSGVYPDTLKDGNGCDSIVNLNLTILHSTKIILSEIALDSFIWINTNVTYYKSGTYYDTLINNDGCDSIIILDLMIDTITVPTFQNGYTMGALEDSADSYQWLDCNNNYAIIPEATDRIYTAPENGSYAVEVSKGGFVDTSRCIVLNVSLSEYSFVDQFKLFPNPTTGQFVIEFDQNQKDVSIRLFSILGQEVVSKNFQNTNRIELDINQPSGIYLLEIMDKKGNREVIKVVKE